jgi:hypothetical protein
MGGEAGRLIFAPHLVDMLHQRIGIYGLGGFGKQRVTLCAGITIRANYVLWGKANSVRGMGYEVRACAQILINGNSDKRGRRNAHALGCALNPGEHGVSELDTAIF